MEQRMKVNMYIATSRRGPSKGPGKYIYLLEYIKKNGEPVTIWGTESLEATYENELALRAIIAAGKRLRKPCRIRIFTGCNHILSATHNGWYIQWKLNGWKKADGKEIRNAALWEELSETLQPHIMTFTKDGHSYEKWMKERMEE